MRDFEKLLAAGHETWPGVTVDKTAAFALLSASGSEDAGAANLADIYIACACAIKATGALEAFELTFMPRVGRFVARMRQPEAFADEVKQLVRERLFVGPAPKIAEYSGRGPLLSWLRVITMRIAIDLRRKRTEVQLSQGSSPNQQEVGGRDAELEYIKERYRSEFKAALQLSIGALSKEERNLLRMHYFEGVTLEGLAGLFHVHRATIARQLARARESLVDEAQRLLSERLALTADEFDSMMGLVRSRLDLSLPGLFRPG